MGLDGSGKGATRRLSPLMLTMTSPIFMRPERCAERPSWSSCTVKGASRLMFIPTPQAPNAR